jgi:hypothetical protein
MNVLLPKLSKVTWLFLVTLLLGSALIRWYRLPDTLFFGFEQGRDALIIDSISSLKDFVLVGPKTDIAGIFHGAWYYYLMVIPYVLGRGNPLVAMFFLVALSSFVPLIMYFLLSDITGQKRWGVVAGVLSATSFELISYSRWLSNVTPAVFFMALTLWFTWKAIDTRRQLFVTLAILSAAFASQFEIILCLWFGFLFIGLWLMRLLPRPNIKSLGWMSLGIACIFAPMLLFNIRNQFISLQSVLHYSEAHGESSFQLVSSLASYGKMLFRLFQKTLFNLPATAVFLGMMLVLLGSCYRLTSQRQKSATILFGCWLLMTLPVIFFPKSLSLTQLYVGTGLGLIGLATLAMRYFCQLKWTKWLAGILILMSLLSVWQSLISLHRNQDVFFITIQDDLNYQDQKALLKYIHQDAAGQPYRLKSFSIPYYQEEGWQYLHQHFYPNHSDIGATHIYVTIEQAVDPFWIKKWTEDLGPTALEAEQSFGKLRVQKRKILKSSEE